MGDTSGAGCEPVADSGGWVAPTREEDRLTATGTSIWQVSSSYCREPALLAATPATVFIAIAPRLAIVGWNRIRSRASSLLRRVDAVPRWFKVQRTTRRGLAGHGGASVLIDRIRNCAICGDDATGIKAASHHSCLSRSANIHTPGFKLSSEDATAVKRPLSPCTARLGARASNTYAKLASFWLGTTWPPNHCADTCVRPSTSNLCGNIHEEASVATTNQS